LGWSVEEVCVRSIPQLEQGSKRACGSRSVCSGFVPGRSGRSPTQTCYSESGHLGAWPHYGSCPGHLSVHFRWFWKMPCNHWDCGSLPRSYGTPCGDGEYRVPWRNCVSPQRFRLLFHHQYAILSLSINIKATSAPAGSRCCNSYWLSGYKKDIKIMKKNPVKCKRARIF